MRRNEVEGKCTRTHYPMHVPLQLVKTFQYGDGGFLNITTTRPQWSSGYVGLNSCVAISCPLFQPSALPYPQEPGVEAEPGSRVYSFLDWFDHDNDMVEASTTDTIAEMIKE